MNFRLPLRAYLVRLADGLDPREDADANPFPVDLEDLELDDEGCFAPDLLLNDEFQPDWVKDDKRVKKVQPVWWVDVQDLPEEHEKLRLGGKYFSQCMGSGVVWKGHDKALEAL